jgi:hypothetical protein
VCLRACALLLSPSIRQLGNSSDLCYNLPVDGIAQLEKESMRAGATFLLIIVALAVSGVAMESLGTAKTNDQVVAEQLKTVTPAPTRTPIPTSTPTPTSTSTPTATPTLTPSPMPSPTATLIGSAKGFPAARGQIVAMRDSVLVQVVGFVADAWPDVKAANPINRPPAPGNRMVIVRVRVTNTSTGSDPRVISDTPFGLVGSSNRLFKSIDSTSSCGIIGDLLSGQLLQGGVSEGNLCWQIPTAETNLLLIYDDGAPDKSYRYLQVGP